MSLQNLPEDFLYQRLPAGRIEEDTRALIQSVVGGYQDRVEDLRSYGKNFQLFFSAVGLPQAGPNVVFVDLTNTGGKTYTRSLDITLDTPTDPDALATWVAQQLNVDPTLLSNIRLGVDLLRLVDANILDYLATNLGAVLYTSAVHSLEPDIINQTGTYSAQTAANQKLIDFYFPRLKFKGTARSFEALGKLMGFDDIRMVPLWSRVSPRLPNDPGSAVNDPDFSQVPEFFPQQELDPFYNPLDQKDGPYYAWFGTVSDGTSQSNFYPQVVNGFQPWVKVEVTGVQGGTVAHPSDGTYALAGGAPHTVASIQAGPDLLFTALGEGDSWNNISVNVSSWDSGTLKRLDILERMSSVKYRSSYYDLGITMDADKADTLFGTVAARPNKDLGASPHAYVSYSGTLFGTSPFRPYTQGTATFASTTGTQSFDFLTPFQGTIVAFQERFEASLFDAQQNFTDLADAGQGVVQALEEVRAATRLPRHANFGYLIQDQAQYAAIKADNCFLIIGTGSHTVHAAGTFANPPLPPYTAQVEFETPTQDYILGAAVNPNDHRSLLYRWQDPTVVNGGTITGTIYLSGTGTNSYTFDAKGTFAQPGTLCVEYFGTIGANNSPDYFEVVRPEFVAPPDTPPSFTLPLGPNWDTFTNSVTFAGRNGVIVSGSPVVSGGFFRGAQFDAFVSFTGGNAFEYIYGEGYADNPGTGYTGPTVNCQLAFTDVFVGTMPGTGGGHPSYIVISQDSNPVLSIGNVVGGTAYPASGTQALFPFSIQAGVASYIRVDIGLEADGAGFNSGHYFGTITNIGSPVFVPGHTNIDDTTRRYFERPEDQVDDFQVFETMDEYLFRRPVTGGGELIESDFWSFTGTDVAQYEILSQTMAVKDQTGAEYNVYVRDPDTTGTGERFVVEARPTDPYQPGQRAIAFTGAFRDQAQLSRNDTDPYAVPGGRTSFYHSELDNVFKPGYQLYHAGIVQGVLVADAPKFANAHHSKNLVGWFPLNEHPDDDVVVFDHANSTASQAISGILPSSRQFDVNQGRFLNLLPNASIESSATRECYDNLTVSFWIYNPNGFPTFEADYVAFGNVFFTRNDIHGFTTIARCEGYVVDSVTGERDLIDLAVISSGWTFIYIRKTATQAFFGHGDLATPVTETELDGNFVANTGQDILTLFGTTSGCSIRDVRIWQSCKTMSEMDKVRYHAPVATVVPYRVGHVLDINTHDRYGLTVLPIGWLAPTGLPAWVRTPKFARVVRYDGDGVFHGEPWRKQVGLGGGQIPPASYQLGNQFYSVTAGGTVVASTQIGVYPGVDDFWLHDAGGTPGSYIKLSGSQATGSIATTVFLPPSGPDWAHFAVVHQWQMDATVGQGVASGPGFKTGAFVFDGTLFVQNSNFFTQEIASGTASGQYTGPAANCLLTFTENYHSTASNSDVLYVQVVQDGQVRANQAYAAAGSFNVPFTVLAGNNSNLQVRYYASVNNGFGYFFSIQGTVTNTGTVATVWPTPTEATNPIVDSIWLPDDTGNLYRVALQSSGVYGASLIAIPGTISYQEQGDGQMLLATPGTKLGVVSYGSVVQKHYTGTLTTPSLYMYLHDILLENVGGNTTFQRWTDPTTFGFQVGFPALAKAGQLNFTNSSSLVAGTYKLTLDVGNIGKVDSDFDGYRVNITVADTTFAETLLTGFSGNNLRGQQEIQFTLDHDITGGSWILTIDWTNALTDASRGTARQLVVYGYQLRKLETNLFKVDIAASGTTPTVARLPILNQSMGTIPGGWVLEYNAFGTVAAQVHEGTIYPQNDTLKSTFPLANLLTAKTNDRFEDVLVGSPFVLVDPSDPVISTFGTGAAVG